MSLPRIPTGHEIQPAGHRELRLPQPTVVAPYLGEKLGHYVYMLLDPRDGRPFYVGKGIDGRCLDHFEEKSEGQKVAKINEIKAAGLEPHVEIIRHGLGSDQEAFAVEAAVIDVLGISLLTNRQSGHGAEEHGRASLADLHARYQAEPADILEPALLFRINPDNFHTLDSEGLYHATRGVWILSPERAQQVTYAFAIYNRIIRRVYVPTAWQRAKISGYPNRTDLLPQHEERNYEFIGEEAPLEVQDRYVGKSAAHCFGKYDALPFKYWPVGFGE
jgi:hypothetical protein